MQFNVKTLGAAVALSAVLFGCVSSTPPATDGEWQSLFNGQNLTGWDTYVGPALDENHDKIEGSTLGLNNDTVGLFTVVDEDGEPAIRISGERGAGISTVDDFSNYHLRLQYKWGDEQPWPWMTRKDSGLLYHAWGEHGVDNDYWMRSHEFQIMQTTTGDYIAIEGATGEIPSRQDGNRWVFDPNGELHTFSRGGFDPEAVSGAARITKSVDYPDSTQWTTVELYALDGTAIHVVNGTVNMALFNSTKYIDGEETPLHGGKLQFQSEGAELFLRNIEVRSIDEIPADILQAAGAANAL